MTNSYKKLNNNSSRFSSIKSKKVEVDFNGGDLTGDGGGLLLRQADRKIGLTKKLNRMLKDTRRKKSCIHRQVHLLRQRIYGLALGYEDLNDHKTLRDDPAFRTFLDREEPLAHTSTLSRFENRTDKQTAWAFHKVLVEQFIASCKTSPEEITLDFDATDDLVHGQQVGRFFHGYYDNYCFLPLYVFCGSQLLTAYLRPSNIDAAKHAWAVLSLLVKRLRQEWPEVRITFRGDSGFCRWRMLKWCELHDIGYIVGFAKNNRINELASSYIEKAERMYNLQAGRQRIFSSVRYAAGTWDKKRRVIVKAEHTEHGSNPRYVVTNLKGSAKHLYEKRYCARGNMENRIKEQQLDLFSDRTSSHEWWSNQCRVLLSAMAYVLIETIRRLGLQGTELAKAQCATIRLKLFKIGAAVLINTRRIRFHLASAYPYKQLFMLLADRLAPG